MNWENSAVGLHKNNKEEQLCTNIQAQMPIYKEENEMNSMRKEHKQSRGWLGKYAELRREYLIKHRRGTYGVLLGEGKLTEHLEKIEEEAQEMLANILSRAVKEQRITEELKARDSLLWVQKMNQAKASAEEFVLREVVYR